MNALRDKYAIVGTGKSRLGQVGANSLSLLEEAIKNALDEAVLTSKEVDGLGVRASGNWLGYTAATFAFFIFLPLWSLAKSGIANFNAPAGEVAKAVGGGVISLLAYGAIIWAMQDSAMGAVSALRETSVVFAALLGAIFLRERLTGWRIAACCIIAAGAVCVGWRF